MTATGISLSPLILGTWSLGGWYWGEQDDALSEETLRAAFDAGISSFDTAPVYGFGKSEKLLGRVFSSARDKIEILSKCGLRWDKKSENFFFEISDGPEKKSVRIYKNLSKESIIHECEQSLRRLQTDYIDIYQIHWPDKTTAIEETAEALQRLMESGKIRSVGVSNMHPDRVHELRRYLSVGFIQNKYNLLERKAESNIIPYANKHRIAFAAYSPLAQGLLSGSMNEDRKFAQDDYRGKYSAFRKENRLNIQQNMKRVQKKLSFADYSFAQLSLAWLFHRKGLSHVINGMRNPFQVKENVQAVEIAFNQEELKVFEGLFS